MLSLPKPVSLSKVLSFMLCCLLPSAHLAQDMSGFRPLQAAGPIPKEFRQLSSEKYSNSRRRLEADAGDRQRVRDKDDFLLESNFVMDQLLSSGKVLFNDPVSIYLDKVLGRVLQDERGLRDSVRVYALRSSVVNAFTTDDGIILISLGLLAQLENEAQLAFIICHELVHFEHEHVINSYVNSVGSKGDGPVKGRSGFDERILARSHYTKELEKEADREGVARFLRSGYAPSGIDNVFDVMRYAHLPFDDVQFDRAFFNSGYFRVPESYFLERVRAVEPLDAKEADDATHPSPSERKAVVKKLLANELNDKGSVSQISQDEFIKTREIARFELSRLYMLANRPVSAIYNSFLLLKAHPDDSFLQEQIARGLYTLAKFKMAGKFGFVHSGYSAIEGESQQLYHLFYRLQPEELCVLALGYIWRLRMHGPTDADIVSMGDDLLRQLMLDHYMPGMFSQTPPDPAPIDTVSHTMSKYDRLRIKQMDDPRQAMLRHAFVDLFTDSTFSAQFDHWEREKWLGRGDGHTVSELQKLKREEQRKWKNSGFHLGLEKVVMVSPAYSKLDLRKRKQHSYLRAESAKMELLKRIERNAKLLNLQTEVLETTLLDSDRVDIFNDIAFLNEWVDQRLFQMEVDMVGLDRERLNDLIDKYGTEHFAWTGVLNYRENKPLLYFYLLYALVPPAIPLAVYYLVRPNYDTYYYCLTFNLRTGEPSMTAYSNFRLKDVSDIINSNLYDSMWQMKSRSRSKQ
jgi:beta-barrel assembly-enhancing protease